MHTPALLSPDRTLPKQGGSRVIREARDAIVALHPAWGRTHTAAAWRGSYNNIWRLAEGFRRLIARQATKIPPVP